MSTTITLDKYDEKSELQALKQFLRSGVELFSFPFMLLWLLPVRYKILKTIKEMRLAEKDYSTCEPCNFISDIDDLAEHARNFANKNFIANKILSAPILELEELSLDLKIASDKEVNSLVQKLALKVQEKCES